MGRITKCPFYGTDFMGRYGTLWDESFQPWVNRVTVPCVAETHIIPLIPERPGRLDHRLPAPRDAPQSSASEDFTS